jgi:hypothetical protein
MILPMSLTATAVAPTSRYLWRKILMVSSLAIVHFVAFIYCYTAEAFSGPWFPFQMKALPEHAIWQSLVGVLQFPLGTIAVGAGLEESGIFSVAVILNSLLWAVGIYYLARWIVRSIATRRQSRSGPLRS